MCLSCKFAVAFLQHYVNGGGSEDDIGAIAGKICTTLRIEEPRVCTGLSNLFKVSFYRNLKHFNIAFC